MAVPPSNVVATVELHVGGMNCAHCARKVTDALQAIPGVESVHTELEHRRVSVRWVGTSAPEVSTLLAALQQAGYGAKLLPADGAVPTAAGADAWQPNLWLGGGVTLFLMVGEWLLGLGLARWFQWLSFGLAAVVQTVAGARFYQGAWRQLRVGRADMDTLVALGSTTAFGYSTWALLSRHAGHVYFMEAAAILTLISLGHWLEARASARAASTLRALLHLAPPTARRLSPASERRNFLDQRAPAAASTGETVPVAALQPGDLVELRPGDRLPVDGVVVEGHSAVDEAMLTGEAAPVDKSPGAELYAGTLNQNGRLVMRVTATGEATALAHIIAAVQRAQNSRAHIQRLGDRVCSLFVPMVVLVALAAGLWWGLFPESARQVHVSLAPYLWPAHLPLAGPAAGFIIAAAVLIIACPCAMGLATPAAIMTSANAAAARGILIRDGVALELAGRITAVIFDKTGTLTTGQPSVQAVWLASAPPTPVEPLAAALARHSNHPVSRAVAAHFAAEMRTTAAPAVLAAETWREERGAGLEARVKLYKSTPPGFETAVARLGARSWLVECGVDVTGGPEFLGAWSARGATLVGLALNGSLLAWFAVGDRLKPGAAAVVQQLHRRGLQVHLLTGDTPQTAAALAQEIGLPPERVFAGVRPEQKGEFVRRLQATGARVAFVGDGINDAPALEQADLGIAVSRASDVAREAADIILLQSEIEAVPVALGLARATLRVIKQNLFWAFFYNALGVPLAALGLLSPVLCAAAMGASDLIVIGNALRLQRWRG